VSTGAESTFTLTRGALWTTTGGVLMPNVNRNETLAITSAVVAYAKPTISTSGTGFVFKDFIPGGTGPGVTVSGNGTRESNEFVLKPGLVYQAQVVAVTSCTIYFSADHYIRNYVANE
jgi:hypothetical protein